MCNECTKILRNSEYSLCCNCNGLLLALWVSSECNECYHFAYWTKVESEKCCANGSVEINAQKCVSWHNNNSNKYLILSSCSGTRTLLTAYCKVRAECLNEVHLSGRDSMRRCSVACAAIVFK